MADLTARQAVVLAELEAALTPGEIVQGEAVSSRSAGIWRDDSIRAPLLFRPRAAAGVAAVLATCSRHGQSVVTHGGLTGLAEGALTGAADVVLSTEKLNAVVEVDEANRILRAQAGATLQQAQDAATTAGLMLALDLGARGSCTLGGNAATNAGGHQVLRYGMAREQILGLEAVLADGTVVSSMRGMLKDNAGYDLKQLFVGSEGTLGVITELQLRLRPQPRSQCAALLACADLEAASALLRHCDAALGGTLTAFELMWRDFYALVAQQNPPLASDHAYYVLVEALGADPARDEARFADTVLAASERGWLADGVIAKSGSERDALWALRDSVEKTLEFGPASIFDVSLRLSAMSGYVAAVEAELELEWGAEHRLYVFGHAGDGNLHLVVVAGAGDHASRARIARCVYEPLARVGGSISGEHGVGLEKRPWLHLTRSEPELTLMRRLKAALDPQNILNPGRVFVA